LFELDAATGGAMRLEALQIVSERFTSDHDRPVTQGLVNSGSFPMKPFTMIAVALFALIAVAHLFRLFAGWEVVVAGYVIPVWVSQVGLVVAAGLAVMVWREARA
jgi:hypothetical protein